MRDTGLSPDCASYNCLLQALARQAQLLQAGGKQRDRQRQDSTVDAAMRVLEEMRASGVHPNAMCYSTLVQACHALPAYAPTRPRHLGCPSSVPRWRLLDHNTFAASTKAAPLRTCACRLHVFLGGWEWRRHLWRQCGRRAWQRRKTPSISQQPMAESSQVLHERWGPAARVFSVSPGHLCSCLFSAWPPC